MKSLLVYYLSITIPLLALILLVSFHSIDSITFVILLMIWAFIYRPITDGMRLINKGIIQKKEFWKLFVPFRRYDWFMELYFRR